MSAPHSHDPQVIAGKASASRLQTGLGKPFEIDQTHPAQAAAGPGLTGWIG